MSPDHLTRAMQLGHRCPSESSCIISALARISRLLKKSTRSKQAMYNMNKQVQYKATEAGNLYP